MHLGEGLLVVEAPVSDVSAPTSPLEDRRHSAEQDDGEAEKLKVQEEEGERLDEADDEEGVFQAMDMESGKEEDALDAEDKKKPV